MKIWIEKKALQYVLSLSLSLSLGTLISGCGPSGEMGTSSSEEWKDPNQDPMSGQRVFRKQTNEGKASGEQHRGFEGKQTVFIPSTPRSESVMNTPRTEEFDFEIPNISPEEEMDGEHYRPDQIINEIKDQEEVIRSEKKQNERPDSLAQEEAKESIKRDSISKLQIRNTPITRAPITPLTLKTIPSQNEETLREEATHEEATLHTHSNTEPLYTYETDNLLQSVGFYSSGSLENGVRLPDSGLGFQRYAPQRNRAWGTTDLVSLIQNIAEAFKRFFPDHEDIQVGDLSAQEGGKLPKSAHVSHQNGLDADLLYIKNPKTQKFDSQANLELFKFFTASQRVGRIFVSPTVKRHLCSYAKKSNLMNDPLTASALHYLDPLSGHETHFHLRITCPGASQEQCDDQQKLPEGTRC